MSNESYYISNIEKVCSWINKGGGMRLWVTVIIIVAAAVVALVACAGVGAADDGLVAEWHFDEGAGGVLHDSSGNGNSGVIHGATWTEGVSGSALSFDGGDDFVETFGSWGGSDWNEATIEAWVKTSSITGDFQAIVSSTECNFFHLQLHSEGNIAFWSEAGITYFPIISQSPTGVWRHIAISVKSGSSKLYVDGIEVGSASIAFSYITKATELHIGNGHQNGRFFNGIIDEICIYNRALTADEIREHYVIVEELTQLTTHSLRDMEPDWSPDDTKILYESDYRSTWPSTHIWEMNADGTGKKQLTFDGPMAGSGRYSPDGTQIVYDKYFGSLALMSSDGDTSGFEIIVPCDWGLCGTPNPSWSPDGNKIVYSLHDVVKNKHEIWIIDPETRVKEKLTEDTYCETTPIWSPDGTKIAFNRENDIWLMNSDGTDKNKITDTTEIQEYAYSWSPDSTMLAFHSNKFGNWDVFIMKIDGSDITRLTTDQSSDSAPAWSHSGDKIAFMSDRSGNYDIWVMKLDENNPPVITSITAVSSAVGQGETSIITVVASDSDEDELSYFYDPTGGQISGSGNVVTWTAPVAAPSAPPIAGLFKVYVTVSDGEESARDTVDILVTEEEMPDLIIKSITGPSPDPKKGESVPITVTIENIGNAAADSSHVRLYIRHIEVDSASVGPIAAGATVSRTFTWTADSCGSTGVSAIADADKEVDESNEGNNDLPETIYVKCPDLEITDISWNPEDDLQAGDDVTISYKIKNKGDVDTGEFKITIFIDGNEFKTTTHPPLPANNEIKVDVGVWKAVKGSHPIRVKADVENMVDEPDEMNNNEEETIIVGPPPDLYIVGFEITQGIQNMEENGIDNSVPLIYGKPMVVRVFVESDSEVVNGVTGKLRLIQYGKTKLELNENAEIDVGPSGSWSRENFDDSLNFIIYRGYLETANPAINYGDVTFEVEINPGHSITEKNYTNNKKEKTRYLHESPHIELKFVFLNVKGNKPTYRDFQNTLSYLERTYPVNKFDYTYRNKPMDVLYDVSTEDGYDQVLPDLNSLRSVSDRLLNRGPYYIGLFANTGFYTYLVGQADMNGRTAIAKAMSEDSYNEGRVSSVTVPHELAHNLGRKHVDCPPGVPENIDHSYPYNPCRISDDNDNYGYYGFDIQRKIVIPPWKYADFMSYYTDKWVSNYTYEAIYKNLTDISASQFTTSLELSQMSYENDYLLISGKINHPTGEVIFYPFYLLTDFNGTYQPGEGSYSIELIDTQNMVFLTHSFELSYPVADVTFTDGELDKEMGFFVEVVPYPPETKRLVLKHNSTELALITVSDHAPNVTVISPNGCETLSGVVNVTWLASDLDGDELYYIVGYSPDNGSTWDTLAINFNETRYPLNTSYLQGTSEGLIRITASDGVNTGYDISDTVFTVLKKPPEVCIVNPTNGTTITESTHISLTGAGYDLEDGMLNGSALTWISDQNGILGTGEDLQTRNLTRGIHVITLIGEDSDSNRATDHIQISVIDSATIDTLKGTARLSTSSGVFIGACRVNESILPTLPDTEFPFGVFSFNISKITNGQTVDIIINLPQDLSSDARYWKYGRTIDNTTPHWYEILMNISEDNRTVTIQLTDGGIGDDDLTANGVIVDAGAPGIFKEILQKSIELYSGWNLISTPINLTSWKLGDESTVGDPLNVIPKNSLISIYWYNTTSAKFEKSDHFEDWGWYPSTGSENFTELEPGRGYWLMADQDCVLTFNGTSPSDLDITLNEDWNLVGWYSMSEAMLGDEGVVGNPLNVTPKNSLTSICRYNATAGSFEKCDHFPDWGWWPATESEGFTKLEPGKGYWVMAENECVWGHEI